MSRLEELVEIVLWSGWITCERPVSAILIAPPGSGKTSLFEMYESEFTPFLSDATSREISSVLNKYKHARHLLIGDFVSIMRHKKSTTDLTVNMLSQLSGDSLKVDSFTGKDAESKRMGIVTAIPPDDLRDKQVQKALSKGGFASRFVMATFSYKNETIREIHRYIRSGKYRKEPTRITSKIGPPLREIAISQELAHEVERIALIVKRDPIGARAHHYMRTMAMAIAARSGAMCVKPEHVRKLSELSEFFTKDGVQI